MKFLRIFLLLLLATCNFVHGDLKTPCHFIFGDSLFDVGNNNQLITFAKANYLPYGVDFPGNVANGRFTNGLTIADVLTKLLGIEEFIQPFTTASDIESLKGVNYASGSSGIRPESGSHLGDRVWLAKQVLNHGLTVEKLQPYVKGPVPEYLNKCLYTVNIGSNDYINNYYMPQYYPSMATFNLDQFATELITEYGQQLKSLYTYGARKIAIFGLGQIGCTPAEIRMNKAIQCVEEINKAVMLFNEKLILLIDYLNVNLIGAKLTYIDTIAIQSASPPPPGFNVVDTCCKVTSDFQCEPNFPPCPNRNYYAFMDGYHPTEVINLQTAQAAFIATNCTFVRPVDINTLANLL
ncbi:GDSL esterase/lipase At4g18970-like [Silene latifolia]|uniref:GDSL esterase/lipase At4g18970-like n=1 Tax=Silene latifolia TaxID=37657 RepID=UPI003D78900D